MPPPFSRVARIHEWHDEECFVKGAELNIAEVEHERRIFEQLGPHPNIVQYKGLTRDGDLLLRRMKRGCLYEHLEAAETPPPFTTRAQWAIDIARGMGHLHAHGVVWRDCHMGNVLLTDDGNHVVICDFGSAHIWPTVFTSKRITVPKPFLIPSWLEYGVQNTFSPDIFALTCLILFLFTWRMPYAPRDGLNPYWDPEDYEKYIEQTHGTEPFGELDVKRFGLWLPEVIRKGFAIEYATAADLAEDLDRAFEEWKVSFSKNEVPDPDASIVDVPRPVALSNGDCLHAYTSLANGLPSDEGHESTEWRVAPRLEQLTAMIENLSQLIESAAVGVTVDDQPSLASLQQSVEQLNIRFCRAVGQA